MNARVTLSEYQHPRYAYRVRFPGPDGKRKDSYFTNKTDALLFKREREKELGNQGEKFAGTTEAERAALMFWRGFEKESTRKPPELLTVLKDFKDSWMADNASLTVADAVDKFIEYQEAEESSGRHIATLRSRLGRFSEDMGECLVSTITTGIFTDWLNSLRATRADKVGQRLSLVTRRNLARSLRSFFVFAGERGWTLVNPVPAAKRSKSKAAKLATKKAPAIMLPREVERFMYSAQSHAPAIVPFWAIKFFAGIRDAEAARMDWSMIDLRRKKIHLPASVTKTGDERTVKIEASLTAWLKPYRKTSGKICPADTTRKRAFKKVLFELATKNKKGAVTKPFVFPSNAARHSYGTYHLFHFRNAGETALQLGHKGNPSMLHEHYKNPSAEKHAADFWKIFPMAEVNVVSMEQTNDKSATRPVVAKSL